MKEELILGGNLKTSDVSIATVGLAFTKDFKNDKFQISFFWDFFCKFYSFQNSYFFGNTHFSLRSLPFLEGFGDFKLPKEYTLRGSVN